MKTTFAGKTTRQTKTMSQPDASTGQNVISLAPPDYGIDFVDRELAAGPREKLQARSADSVQRKGRGEGFWLDDETASRINRARGGGKLLDGTIQEQMGDMMGHDFCSVRVHTDSEADALNRQLGAKAFTTGRDIFFRQGQYDPTSSDGKRLIAHELSHVVQQRTGRAGGDGTGGEGGGISVRPAGDSFEQEAESVARLLPAQHGTTDLTLHHMSARQTTKVKTPHRSMLNQPLYTDKSNGQTAQRHCWAMTGPQQASFMEGAEVEHRGEADDPNQVFWRMQAGDVPTHSCYFAPVTDNPPDIEHIIDDGQVTQDERAQLAVLHEWVQQWNFLVLYEVTSQTKERPYWGMTGQQTDESGTVYQGGAFQVVFPATRRATAIAYVPVVEVE